MYTLLHSLLHAILPHTCISAVDTRNSLNHLPNRESAYVLLHKAASSEPSTPLDDPRARGVEKGVRGKDPLRTGIHIGSASRESQPFHL
ncbi:hypothetical protein F5B17DRAFT_391920 [Nemania serpens]|nr:hypothetical protein F5B17DRAFT_391920 [Nemania serpens]